jgi:4a-hydroxytetrahydrobiopterin dehydratase
MSALAEKQCVPCKEGAEPLKGEALKKLASELNRDWRIVGEKRLERDLRFKDFRQALNFVNRAGEVAEEQGHHPDLCFGWGYVKVQLSTHSAGGLTESDFVLAAKLDKFS